MEEITDFRIIDMIDPEDGWDPSPLVELAREEGFVIANCRFCVNGEPAAALVPIPRGAIDDSEYDLDAHCREMSQKWANDQRRNDDSKHDAPA